LLSLNHGKRSLIQPPFGFHPFRCYALESSIGAQTIPSEYSLSDVLERLYQNQLALEAAVKELTLKERRTHQTGLG
jgi:hypothetical protein